MVAPNNEAVEVNEQAQEMTVEQKKELLSTLMSEGRREFAASNFSAASEKLGEAADLSVKVYGDFSAESFEPHFYYGRAMLELGRAQDDVLDNAMKDLPIPDEDDSIDEEQFGNPENLTEEEKDDIKEKVEEALTEGGDAEKSTEEKSSAEEPVETSPADSADGSTEDTAEKVDVVAEDGTVEEASDEVADEDKADCEVSAEGMDVDAEEEEDDEATETQIAWEVLEVARKICEAQESSQEWDLKKADVLLELADCSICNEKYQEALDDLNVCLELQKKYLSPCDRSIAQTYITMARAYKLFDDFFNAAKNYKLTKETLVAKLAEVNVEFEKTTDEEVKSKLASDVDELKTIISDLDLKIEDATESGKQTEENLNKIREQIGLKSGNALSEKTSEPAGDITNMVRKPVKRSAESEPENAKKAKEDSSVDDPTAATA